MKYREILENRQKARKRVEDLKAARDLNNNNYELTEKIKKEKFKYKIYNSLLKERK